ncbi:MAG: hypothetical protein ACTSXP_12480 [Promethearchaeota archaeon]
MVRLKETSGGTLWALGVAWMRGDGVGTLLQNQSLWMCSAQVFTLATTQVLNR